MGTNGEFNIEVSEDGAEIAVVSVAGEIDIDNAHSLRSVVSVAAGWNETSRVVVDLSAVTLMDSSGISALLLCHRDCQASGIGFEAVGAQGGPLKVLELTGVLELLSARPADELNA